jgi:hypothetical protein
MVPPYNPRNCVPVRQRAELHLSLENRFFGCRIQLIGLVALSCLSSGCQNAAAGRDDQGRIEPTYDRSTGRLTRIDYDANANGKTETWAYMDGARLIRLEADENEDGKIDRWEYYPAAGGAAALKQPPERIERATRFDGQVSRREFFAGGVMVRVEEDTDGNGSTDKWETYADGALAVLALDTRGRGKPDRRLIYRPDGSLDRIEADASGSGDFQTVRQ